MIAEQNSELEIDDSELAYVNTDAESVISRYVSENRKSASKTIIVYEAERTASYRGVTNCNEQRDLTHVKQLSDTFAKSKEQETGLKLIEHGWRAWQSRITRGSEPWPSNARWCRSYITVRCFAIFES